MRRFNVKKIVLWIISIILLTFIISLTAIYFYTNSVFKNVKKVEVNEEKIGVTEEVKENLDKYDGFILNIALFGVDSEEGQVGRSDSIMIATIDTKHKKIKLSSIMRDSYVDIEGYGLDKINHAYAYGGPELALNTINKNFNLNITDFATVNFTTLPSIIDKIGGIQVYVDEEEVKFINGYANNTDSSQIQGPGMQLLNGTQALDYCRIRYTEGNDFKRTERQREVMSAVFQKVKEVPLTQMTELLNEILPAVETNLSSSKIISLATETIKTGMSSIEKERFPTDNYINGEMIDGVYYLVFDKEATVKQIHEYIFEDKAVE